jgi:hypothetical protein
MSPSSRAGAFEGDLEALSVVELVQTLSLGAKTARVLVSSNTRRGELWFRDGVITHAAAGSLFGDLAVYAIIEWTTGQFFVEYGLTSEARSITQDTTYLVLEGLRRFDERSSGGPSPADPVKVPPVHNPDARRNSSRRLVVGLMAVGIAAAAIVTAALRDGRSPSATDAVAAVVAVPEASFVRKAPPKRAPAKRSTSVPSLPKPEAAIVEAPPVVAPESPAAEEPVPANALLAPQVTPDAGPVAITIKAPDESPRLHISGTSGANGGSLTVLVDGTPAYTHEKLGKREPFQAEIVLTPGEHLIVARLEDGARDGVYEDSTRSVFVQGEHRLLAITANRTLGSPVKIKLGRLADPPNVAF